MDKGYRTRKESIRNECKVFVIVCEGETEQIYFNSYRKRRCNLIIKTPNSDVTDPVNLVKFAKTQINKYDLDFSKGDEIYCVFDADGNTDNNISKAVKEAGKEVKVIFSNPSFEIWYLLHFLYATNRIDNKALINSLSKYISKYKKTVDFSQLLRDKKETAIKNAKKLNDYHKTKKNKLNSVSSNPSTQVFKLVEAIIKNRGCMD